MGRGQAVLVAGWVMMVGAWLWAAAPPKDHRTYAQMSDTEISAVLKDAQRVKDLGERVQRVSDPFVGTPYLLGNLGEGPDGDGRDQDPRFNVATVDCTTLVEHSLALALTADVAGARVMLDRIRYVHGEVNYGKRRHWPEAQWVPGLVEEGYLQDATQEVAGPGGRVETASVTLGPAAFRVSSHTDMPLRPEEIPQGVFGVPYVPLEDALKAQNRMQAGMVINVVKAEKTGLLVRISHQGLVVKKNGQVLVRNATSAGPKAVVDEPFNTFVMRQKAAKSWRTVGFHFLRPTVPPPQPG